MLNEDTTCEIDILDSPEYGTEFVQGSVNVQVRCVLFVSFFLYQVPYFSRVHFSFTH